MKIYMTKKVVAAKTFSAMSLADIQGKVPQPTQKHACKRKHKWVTRKYSRRCTRCGQEEMI